MINWYYVQGSERMGPVGEETLRDLFNRGELTMESYIWKKGFQNWERLKDVGELNFSETQVFEDETPPEEESPEMSFTFEWNKIQDNEEIFYLKIGKDRKYADTKVYGPYSKNELKDAIEEKRINDHTQVFAVGMKGWSVIGETPLNKTKLRFNPDYSIEAAPLLMVVPSEPLPLVAVVEHAKNKECTLLGAGAFQTAHALNCSLYQGSNLKAKNVKVDILNYDPKEQKVHCRIVEMNDEAKYVIHNYAH